MDYEEEGDQPELHFLGLVAECLHGEKSSERSEECEYKQGVLAYPASIACSLPLIPCKRTCCNQIRTEIEEDKCSDYSDADPLPGSLSR